MEAIQRVTLFTNLFYISLGVAGIGLLLSVFLFIYFDIPMVFSLLTGKAMKKSLEQKHEQIEQGGSIREKSPSSRELKRGATKTRSGQSNWLGPNTNQTRAALTKTGPDTEAIQNTPDDAPNAYNPLPEKPETTVLNAKDQYDAGATAPLSAVNGSSLAVHFRVIEEIIMVHTNEII